MRKKHKKIINLNNLWLFELLLTIIFCSFCFFQVITISSGKYMASEFEEKIASLSRQKKDLEVQLSENSFLGKAEKLVDSSSFEEVGEISYIRVSESTIVSK
jgi:hypothetical protein